MIKASISESRGFYTGLFHFQIKKKSYRMPDLPSDHVGFFCISVSLLNNFVMTVKHRKLVRKRGSIQLQYSNL